jgi:2-succinyl-6-hydroxy-2,4-cyclohexadiene-1-carboxylate synthase
MAHPAVRYFGTATNLVALHGFASTGEQFVALSELIDRPVSAPDLPGHGRSHAAPCDFQAVLRWLSDVTPPGAPLLGYSQGARLALAGTCLGYLHPSSLILISGTPGIEDESERVDRKNADEELATKIESMPIGDFIDEWTNTGLTSMTHLPRDVRSDDRAIRVENTPAGLAAALRGYGQGAMPSVWPHLPKLKVPALLVAGSRDRKYRDVALQTAEAIGPLATAKIIDSSGHNPMFDQPEELGELISGFLDGNG